MRPNLSLEPWSVCFKPQPLAALRLVCLAHAGSGPNVFSTWHSQLPARVEVCAVQLPGRELRGKESFLLEFSTLIDTLLAALAPLHDRPVALFGHGLGGLIAFEYARALRRTERHGPVQLIVGATHAPQQPLAPAIHRLRQSEFIRELSARYDGMAHTLLHDPALLAYVLPIVRADLALFASYRYRSEPPLACPIAAFCGRDDPHVSLEDAAGWREHTSAEFDTRMFNGGHAFISSARDHVLSTIAQLLENALERQRP